jgi:hypothetical protein
VAGLVATSYSVASRRVAHFRAKKKRSTLSVARGAPIAPTCYVIVSALITAIAIFSLRETAREKLR